MINFFIAAGVFTVLFLFLLACAFLGRRYGKWRIAHDEMEKLEVLNVAEGAVFALLGLLVAFTFTGAYERFEARKMYIIEEANAIDSAHLAIDLLAPSTQPLLHQTLREYVDAHLMIYGKIPTLQSFQVEIDHFKQVKSKLWNEVIAACKLTNDQAATTLVVASVAKMFEIANMRKDVAKVHPPLVIFMLLMILAALSAFLAGYSTAGGKTSNALYIVSYAAITAFTIYIILDLEVPRAGMIRVDTFDSVLMDVRSDLK